MGLGLRVHWAFFCIGLGGGSGLLVFSMGRGSKYLVWVKVVSI